MLLHYQKANSHAQRRVPSDILVKDCNKRAFWLLAHLIPRGC